MERTLHVYSLILYYMTIYAENIKTKSFNGDLFIMLIILTIYRIHFANYSEIISL